MGAYRQRLHLEEWGGFRTSKLDAARSTGNAQEGINETDFLNYTGLSFIIFFILCKHIASFLYKSFLRNAF